MELEKWKSEKLEKWKIWKKLEKTTDNEAVRH